MSTGTRFTVCTEVMTPNGVVATVTWTAGGKHYMTVERDCTLAMAAAQQLETERAEQENEGFRLVGPQGVDDDPRDEG